MGARELRLPGLRLVPVGAELGRQAARLAADLRLRGANAVYVAVAARLDIPLVTWDGEQLARAGGRVRVTTP
jgi:predicted nucleic acid-binding protein